ncbi:anti-phage ZorAB system protein ZorA [Neptunomonas qingdaonensis]|uniref:Uncharacterized protein n=1 Tax=Neptunomonas qingdaonensis TaxID=1045558 RepID=A0A1I2TW24_9GAMM|nr:anti-phage ZorAB system protein ZorA [Neptunomonas qingdaonensis]SFG68419.1 hypothetical protein SAMN05216175_11121 [Neptunomonas qingdaonensis]
MLELLFHLWPNFSLLLEPGTQTMELSVWFWIGMMAILAIAVTSVVYHYFSFRSRYKQVKSLIKELDKANLAYMRTETLEKAQQTKSKQVGSLWREFDESLVFSSDQKKLYNTLDAEHFFNSSTLAYGLSSSRLLAATPSFLTAIGVLGTFIGLTIGLTDLQVSTSDVDDLKKGVASMINGAAVAFMTSVWGVSSSLFLNVFEKLFERSALGSINRLQHEIDFLYPRLPAEQALVEIADSSRETKEALQELHERIGDRFQETVSGISDSMQTAFTDALNNVMAPALKTLAEQAGQQSSDVLEKLASNFMGSMETAGTQQGEMMDKAASDVSSAVSSMAIKMDLLFNTLTEQQNRDRAHTEQYSREFAEQLKNHRAEATHSQTEMETCFNGLMQSLTNQLSDQLGAAEKHDQERQNIFNSVLKESTASQRDLLASQLEAVNDRDVKRAAHISQVQRELVTQQQSMISTFSAASSDQLNRMEEVTGLQQNNLEKVFQKTISNLDNQITSHNEAAQQRETELQQRFQNQLEQIVSEQHQLMKVVSEGVSVTQKQMLQMADQHQVLIKELSTAAGAAERSSQNMSNSSNQLSMLSSNLKQVTDVLDIRLKAVTDSIEGASQQNHELASQVREQASSLEMLQTSLNEATQHFESAAKVAHEGFSHLGTHQQAFLEGVRHEFDNLGGSLRTQVEGIEKQAEEWLRSYSDEVRQQVTERMELWNETTMAFADEMKRTVHAISGIVDDLEKR